MKQIISSKQNCSTVPVRNKKKASTKDDDNSDCIQVDTVDNRNTDDKTATLCETKKNHYTFSRRRRTNTQFKSTGKKRDNTAVNEDHDYFNPFEEYERNTQDKDFIASQSTGVVKKNV